MVDFDDPGLDDVKWKLFQNSLGLESNHLQALVSNTVTWQKKYRGLCILIDNAATCCAHVMGGYINRSLSININNKELSLHR